MSAEAPAAAEARAAAETQAAVETECGWRSLLGDLGPIEQRELVAVLPGPSARAANAAWPLWAHRGQLEPPGDWTSWVLMAGRGFGKTLAGSQWIARGAAGDGRLRIALVGATIDEARRVMVEGKSGLLAVAGDRIAEWRPTRRLLRFKNGAQATLFSGASPEALRGPEHHIAWCDELAKWDKPGETWDMLQLGLRLGERPRALVTTTPRPGPVLRRIMASPGCEITRGSTHANPHLPPAYKETVEALYAGTRLGRQELDGELLSDAPGALWTVELIERCRPKILPEPKARGGGPRPQGVVEGSYSCAEENPSTMLRMVPLPEASLQGGTWSRIVIGVDPPSGDGTCGIVACARDAGGRGHVLADHSVTARSPEGWARAVADAARIWSSPSLLGEGDRPQGGGGAGGGGAGVIPVLVVAEANQGGRMVEAVLRTADPALRVRPVNATVGKAERAAPVAMLFEAGKVVLHGRLPELEAELLGMIAGGGYEGPGVSPDRADAMVWALTALMLGKERAEVRVRVL